MQEKLQAKPADLADMKIAAAAGITPYLKQSKVKQFFSDFLDRLAKAGYRWTSHEQHRKLLDDFEDVGGLDAVPPDIRSKIVLWMLRCYIGEPVGTAWGTTGRSSTVTSRGPGLRRHSSRRVRLLNTTSRQRRRTNW